MNKKIKPMVINDIIFKEMFSQEQYLVLFLKEFFKNKIDLEEMIIYKEHELKRKK